MLLQQELERVPSGTLSQTSTPQAQSGSAQQGAAAKAWGHLLYAFALVARHDPRARVADTAGAALLVSNEGLQLVLQFNVMGGHQKPQGGCLMCLGCLIVCSILELPPLWCMQIILVPWSCIC